MDKRVLLLKKLVKEKIELLKPQANRDSFCGYWYPEVNGVFETTPGKEIEHLESLAELGYLERSFFDRIHLCPFCSHFVLNFREACLRCDSTNIEIVEMLHHFRCGYVASEVEFRDGIRYVCPKCNRLLHHIGVDYERPTSNYLCASCKHIFPEPKISCCCLNCGGVFGVEKAVMRTIYNYRLGIKGILAANRGTIEEVELSKVFIDADFAVYTFSFFKERLIQEIRRAYRYGRSLSIMLVGVDHLEVYEAKFGKGAAVSLFKSITLVLKEVLRDSDIPALYSEDTLSFMLPDTSLEGAFIAAERMRKKVFELNHPGWGSKITLSIGLVSLSDNNKKIENAKQMIDAANERLQEARRRGGDCVWPALESTKMG